MARDILQYDKMVEGALRGVVRESLGYAAKNGLPGNHHFYLTFSTTHPGVEISESLHAQYPSDMTIVLQHQFWGLEAAEDHFVVNLSFNNVPERLHIPYAALLSFVDPSVKFGLQFQPSDAPPQAAKPVAAVPAKKPETKKAETKPLLAVDKPAEAQKPETRTEPQKADAKTEAKPETKPDAGKPAAEDAGSGEQAVSGKDAADGDAPNKVVSLDAFRKK